MSIVNVNTKYTDELIISEVCCEIEDSFPDRIVRRVIDLQNEGIKQALIELGWTPPPKE